MAELTVQQIDRAGGAILNDDLVAADVAGDTFINNGRTMLVVDNQDASPITVTIDSPVDCDQGFEHDPDPTVGAGDTVILGPFAQGRFNTDGKVVVAYSAVASVTVVAYSQ